MLQPVDTQPAEAAPPDRPRLVAARADVLEFLLHLARRFLDDVCLERAAALSYTSVLSLVPAAGVSLAFLSVIPQSGELRSSIEELLTTYLLPNAGETAVEAFRAFLGKAAGLSAFGFVGLAVSAMLLLMTVNAGFDAIWRVRQPRPLLIRLLAYWAILTIGPVLFGTALSISALLFATGQQYGGSAFTWSMGWFAPLLPFILEAAAFTLLYYAAPNCPVRWRDSLAGGAAAALVFEGAKRGFAVYLAWFPTYNALYGALAAIPVFLAWIYLCWVATFVGAEVAALLPEWRTHRSRRRH
ncbi:MAG TPA: YhjD/YihY/BrkB family envelope integrity protein [Methylomirabilota bacterium]|nr:YhjD/YihY/BrkB family envelope integrity protein [Methylomirabilota bacterium]